MVSGKAGIESRSYPLDGARLCLLRVSVDMKFWARILELAQHKDSKTVWVTTPCQKLTWGNQESIWPLSDAALAAVPTDRTQLLAQHKKDFSAYNNDQLRKEEEDEDSSRKALRPFSRSSQYDHLVHLSTPKRRSRSSQEVRPPHSVWCEYSCPIWHIDPRARDAEASPRLLQLASPKRIHGSFNSNREAVETDISYAARTARTTLRLEQLSLPKMRGSSMFYERGRPEAPIWPVSRGARRATATPRVRDLSLPKVLVKDYVPPREPVWP